MFNDSGEFADLDESFGSGDPGEPGDSGESADSCQSGVSCE